MLSYVQVSTEKWVLDCTDFKGVEWYDTASLVANLKRASKQAVIDFQLQWDVVKGFIHHMHKHYECWVWFMLLHSWLGPSSKHIWWHCNYTSGKLFQMNYMDVWNSQNTTRQVRNDTTMRSCTLCHFLTMPCGACYVDTTNVAIVMLFSVFYFKSIFGYNLLHWEL